MHHAGRRIRLHAAVEECQFSLTAGEPSAVAVFEPGGERPAGEFICHLATPAPGTSVST